MQDLRLRTLILFPSSLVSVDTKDFVFSGVLIIGEELISRLSTGLVLSRHVGLWSQSTQCT